MMILTKSKVKLSTFVSSDRKDTGQRFVHLTVNVDNFDYEGVIYNCFIYCEAESNGPFRYYTPEYLDEMLYEPEKNMDKLVMYSNGRRIGRIKDVITDPDVRHRVVNALTKLIVEFKLDGEYGYQEF